MLGWIVAGAAALGGFLLYKEGAFGGGVPAPEPKATRVTRAPHTGPKGLDLMVLQADEDQQGWDVIATEYEMRDGEMGNGRIRQITNYPTKKAATAAARAMFADAEEDGRYAALRFRGGRM